MKKNYLIGIGGTGARVIESAVYLCAAGYGPDNLTVFLIDPDSGNGNLDRTKTVIKRYQECRKKLGGFCDPRSGKIFKTDIKIPGTKKEDEQLVWGIFTADAKDGDATKLNNMLGYNIMKDQAPGLSQVVDLLFTKEELDSQLTEGFRGHPSIGALTMSSAINEDKVFDKEPWKTFMKDVEMMTNANDIGVFLVGSIFGGTGAAGVPTFAHKSILKENPKAKIGELSKIALGGALVLPYFSYDKDPANEKKEKDAGKIFAKVEEFALATKAALSFYNEKELGFDQVYFIGDSSAYSVGGFATGKGEQKNNAHYIEIVTALSSFDFFSQPVTTKDKIQKKHFIASRKDDSISWDSFPVGRTSDDLTKQGDLKKSLISMTILSYSFLSYLTWCLKNEKDTEVQNAAWYNTLFRKFKNTDKDIFGAGNQENIKNNFVPFFKNYLYWLDSISSLHESGAAGSSEKIRLLKNNFLPTESPDNEDAPLPFEGFQASIIGNLVKERSQDMTMQDYIHKYINPTSQSLPDKDKKEAIEKVVELFCTASLRFCEDNHSVKKDDNNGKKN
ncbi:MAG TPA: hypothetical protein PLZ43_13695 [bacterium]|mgnify:CR=1 FL=1|nr:hypothetical protein [bacterium]